MDKRDIDELFLAHAGDSLGQYNAQAAHDYYERHKKLKGRRHGLGIMDSIDGSQTAKAVAVKKPHRTKAQLRAAKQKAIKAKVAEIQARLDHLKEILAELVKQAQERSGVETKATTTKTTASKATKKDVKPLTAAEKHKAAIAAKKSAAKNKKATPKETADNLSKQVAAVEEKIATVRKQLKVAVAKSKAKESAKAKAASATKTKPKATALSGATKVKERSLS